MNSIKKTKFDPRVRGDRFIAVIMRRNALLCAQSARHCAPTETMPIPVRNETHE